MEKQFKQTSGLSLIVGSLVLIATMVLHPSGGSIERILKIREVIVVSHALAIVSLPFVAFGFYGLSVLLLTPSRISILAFITIAFGLVAVMIAGTINGLTLPMFLSHYTDKLNQDLTVPQAVIRYGFAINQPMDYIFIVAGVVSVGIWSVLMIRGSQFPKWIGYYGLSLLVLAAVAAIFRFNFVDLYGFRLVVFGVVSWIISVGVFMLTKPNPLLARR